MQRRYEEGDHINKFSEESQDSLRGIIDANRSCATSGASDNIVEGQFIPSPTDSQMAKILKKQREGAEQPSKSTTSPSDDAHKYPNHRGANAKPLSALHPQSRALGSSDDSAGKNPAAGADKELARKLFQRMALLHREESSQTAGNTDVRNQGPAFGSFVPEGPQQQ